MPLLTVSAVAFALFAHVHVDLPAKTEIGIDPAAHPEIVQVRCITSLGTAFYTGPRTLLTAAHVVNNPICRINGKEFEVVSQVGDFAILSVAKPVKKWLRIDCGGFKTGQTYTAYGYARGVRTLTTVDSEAKGEILDGFYRLWGIFHAIPGQSGGPYKDNVTGAVPGMVNVYNAQRGDSGSIELKGTSVCKGSAAAT